MIYVPFYRGVALTGYTASSREDVVDERGGLHDWLGDRVRRPDFHVQEVMAEVVPLDDLDLSPAIVKIDVEGSELRVLRGLAATLERCQPILLVERSGDFEAIQQLLEARGYSAYGYQGRRRAVHSLHLCRRRSQRVLHASRGDSPRRLRALR